MMSLREMSLEDLNSLIDKKLQPEREQHEKQRRESEETIRRLTERLDRMDIQMKEERSKFEEERANFEVTMRTKLNQIMDEHREEINSLTQRYEQEKGALKSDLETLRREYAETNGRQVTRIADLERQLQQQNRAAQGNVTTVANVSDTEASAIEKLIEFLKADGNDAFWQKFFAGGECTLGVVFMCGVYIASSKVIAILLALLATGMTIDAIRRFIKASRMPGSPREHQN